MNFNNIGKSTPYFNIYKSLDGISRSAKPNKFVLLSTYPYICNPITIKAYQWHHQNTVAEAVSDGKGRNHCH